MRRIRLLGPVALALAAAACLPPAQPPPPPPGELTIMGPSELTAAQIADYVCFVNRCTPVSAGGTWKPEITPTEMAQLYIDEGTVVGVRGDIAFCQSVLETGWFSWPSSPWPETAQPDDGTWPGYVQAVDHNYAGLGAYTGSNRYMRKPNAQVGARAQLQHLRNYADPASRSTNLGYPFEPRPHYDANAFDTFVYKGQAPTWVGLNGKWAVPGTTYAQTILSICNNMRTHAGLTPLASSSLSAQSPTSPQDFAAQIDADAAQLQRETTSRN